MPVFRNDILESAAFQLALDFACSPEDFRKKENTVIRSKLLTERRRFRKDPDFFRIACFGNGAVAAVDSRIYDFTKELLDKINGIELFDAKAIYLINKELEKHGKAIGSFNQYYLPNTPYQYPFPDNTGFCTVIVEEEDMPSLYHDKRFSNALMYEKKNGRHDVLAVCAMNGNNIIGIAGASDDSDRMWQIGVDVLPEYREKGTASVLVSMLTREVFMRGAIPYYGTWWSNIASRNVARRCGYYPAWVEMTAVTIE